MLKQENNQMLDQQMVYKISVAKFTTVKEAEITNFHKTTQPILKVTNHN